MSRSLNKVMLIGNVGGDPEIRSTQTGTRVAKLSLATNRTWQGRNGERQEKTEWHRLTFFGRLVDIVESWVTKGKRLFVEGRIEYSQSQNERGDTRYWTEISVDNMVMLDSAPGTGPIRGAGAPARGGYSGLPSGEGATARKGSASDTALTEPEDDLPF